MKRLSLVLAAVLMGGCSQIGDGYTPDHVPSADMNLPKGDKQVEYRIIRECYPTVSTLNMMGVAGWELCSVRGTNLGDDYLIFKRRKS